MVLERFIEQKKKKIYHKGKYLRRRRRLKISGPDTSLKNKRPQREIHLSAGNGAEKSLKLGFHLSAKKEY